MGRQAAAMAAAAACSSKPKLRRGLWSPEEDEKLYNHIIRHGVGCWSSVPKLAGLERCGKSCRLRWINYLRPDLKRGSFSQQEEDLIISLHKILGNRWSQIASQLPGRTDNEIKNFWNSSIKKKLKQRGIDPATHKPLTGDTAVAAADERKQLPAEEDDDEHRFGAMGLQDPHSPPDTSFDPMSVTTVPSYAAAAAHGSNLGNYDGGSVDVVSDAATYTGGGDSSCNSNGNGSWTCGNVVAGGGHEPVPHMDMDMNMFRDADPYPFDPAKFSPAWHHQQHTRDGGALGFPIRSLSRDMPASCFELAHDALDDEFDFL